MNALKITAALLLSSTTPLFAGNFNIAGAGGAIPASGSGGGGVYPGTLPPNPFISTINIPHPVIEIDGVFLTGLSHSWAGDLHAVLEDPTGKKYNIFERSGSSGGSLGNSFNFTGGGYTFSTAIGGNGVDFPGTGDIPGATYRQDFGNTGTPPTPWVDGTANVFNVNQNDIVAPAGNWSLIIYDWASGDTGSLTSWHLTGVDDFPPISSFCFGDGSIVPCPCGNNGVVGRGCQNSAGTGGAVLSAAGLVNPDTVVLSVTGELPTALTIFIQGSANIVTPLNFGDGLSCIGGFTKRLYIKTAVGGAASAPQGGDLSITARSAALGDTIPLGATRNYQAYYRDANATFCPSPTGNTFNISNGVRIVWY